MLENGKKLESFLDFCDEYQNNGENENLIGVIYIDDIAVEDCSFGQFQYKGPNYVHIFTNDSGSIPHVHITDKKNPKSKNLETDFCVKLMTGEVYPHGNKHNKYGRGGATLNNVQKEKLNEFMRTYNEKHGMTNWEYTTVMWNSAPRNIYIPENTPMPNYLDIK